MKPSILFSNPEPYLDSITPFVMTSPDWIMLLLQHDSLLLSMQSTPTLQLPAQKHLPPMKSCMKNPAATYA